VQVADETRRWTLLSNHGRVLAALAARPDVRLADLATAVGLRERSTHRIVHDLIDAGYVEQRKIGRRSEYRVVRGCPELLRQLADV
jgi:DNA-binding IclR family transcriptional regulator